MEGVYNLSTTTYAFQGLCLQSEAIAPIIREKQGRFNVTSFNLEAGVKGEIQHLEKIPGHDFLQVVFTFHTLGAIFEEI